jgi:hypothetical protein
MPIFDSACFGAGSEFYIPAFKSRRNVPPANEPEMADKAMKQQKEYLRKLTETDDILKFDKYHASSLLSRATVDRDTAVTPTSSQLPPLISHLTSLTSGNPPPPEYAQDNSCHVTSAPDDTEHECATSRMHNGSTE